VLDAVLDLLAAGGDAVTMSAVARRASCSKETLYKWFGDRDGLLTATVRWQASKVRAGAYDDAKLDTSALQASLEAFAANWLRVISPRAPRSRSTAWPSAMPDRARATSARSCLPTAASPSVSA
jgi:AcrR family transcriptional regulator